MKRDKCLLSGQSVKVMVPGGKNNGPTVRVGIPNAQGWELNPWCYALYLENHNYPAGKLPLSNSLFSVV